MTRISIVFATYNRASLLRQTLEAMCTVDRGDLDVEFVVVDNNSKDDTASVIDSFASRLPLRHLFESRPGKNCALNHALDTVELGDIIVFSDDDIIPRPDWLKQIVAACEKWPAYDVFGGKVDAAWPEGVDVPKWITGNPNIRAIGFAEDNRHAQPEPYGPGKHPAGPNFWVRRAALEGGVRYDETIGPRPGQKWGMGSEAELLLRLASNGRQAIHIPDAAVGHYAQASLLKPKNMLKRFIRLGRGEPHLHGIPDPEKLARNPWMWRMRRVAAMAWHLLSFCIAQLQRDECKRMDKATRALRQFAYHRESLVMTWGEASL